VWLPLDAVVEKKKGTNITEREREVLPLPTRSRRRWERRGKVLQKLTKSAEQLTFMRGGRRRTIAPSTSRGREHRRIKKQE